MENRSRGADFYRKMMMEKRKYLKIQCRTSSRIKEIGKTSDRKDS